MLSKSVSTRLRCFASRWPQALFWLSAGCLSLNAHGQSALHLGGTIRDDAKIAMIEPDWTLAFDLPQPNYGSPKLKRFKTGDIVRWGSWIVSDREQVVWLRGGDWIAGDVSLSSRTAQVSGDWLERVRMDMNALRGIILTPPVSMAARAELVQKMQTATGERDLVWLNDGRVASGVVRILDADRTYQRIEVVSSDQAVELSMDAVQAIVFSPALFPKLLIPPNSTSIGLRDGTLLRVVDWRVTSTAVKLQLASGLVVSALDLPTGFAANIVYVAGQPQGVRLLSQQTAASYRYLGKTQLSWPLGQDQDVWGRLLLTKSGVVPNGLAMHAPSQVAYRWDGSAATLSAELAIPNPPPVSQIAGSQLPPELVCKVLVAKAGALTEQLNVRLDGKRWIPNGDPGTDAGSPVGDPSNSAIHFTVDLAGVQLLVLAVESDLPHGYGAQAVWLDARIAQ